MTELLFLPPVAKTKNRTKEDVPVSSNHRGSRISARQRAKQEKILRQKREKEEAEALAGG